MRETLNYGTARREHRTCRWKLPSRYDRGERRGSHYDRRKLHARTRVGDLFTEWSGRG